MRSVTLAHQIRQQILSARLRCSICSVVSNGVPDGPGWAWDYFSPMTTHTLVRIKVGKLSASETMTCW